MNDKKQYFVFPLLILLFTAFRWPGLLPVIPIVFVSPRLLTLSRHCQRLNHPAMPSG